MKTNRTVDQYIVWNNAHGWGVVTAESNENTAFIQFDNNPWSIVEINKDYLLKGNRKTVEVYGVDMYLSELEELCEYLYNEWENMSEFDKIDYEDYQEFEDLKVHEYVYSED